MKAYQQYTAKTKATPQTEPIPGREAEMTRNNAGGFGFTLDRWARLDRFLILGSDGGAYYVGERKLTADNAAVVRECLDADGPRTIQRIVTISDAGRAPKNSAALFALALAAAANDAATRQHAMNALPKTARTGAHLFEFCEYVNGLRSWGRALRAGVGQWYNGMPADALAYQLVKYRQREGWTHRDVLRSAHPHPIDAAHANLLRWVAKDELEAPHTLIEAFTRAQAAPDAKTVCTILAENPCLPWEAVPTQFLGAAEVWEALLPHLPMTALVRNLARMTANGALKPLSPYLDMVTQKLTDATRLRAKRLHPLALLSALRTYADGHGLRGDLTWTPIPQIIDALDAAFYLSFQNVEPTGKRLMLALDVSGSMSKGTLAGVAGVTPRVGCAAMALLTAATERDYAIMAFCHKFVPINISPRQRLADAVQTVSRPDFGGTDCALPMLYAMQEKLAVDAFVIYTDNETWAGAVHPIQALRQYRNETGIPAKLIVAGMIATEFTVADPQDAGMLDVVGFDTAAPALMSDFIADRMTEKQDEGED